jgi:O-methyltransferase
MSLGSVLKRLIPVELQPPADSGRRVLAATGYFHFRTWLAAAGERVPEHRLYRPLYSPWDGEPQFERVYQAVRRHTLVSRDRCFILWKTLQQAARLDGEFVECGVFRGGTALLAANTLAPRSDLGGRRLHLFDSFEGMPDDATGTDRFRRGDFHTTSADEVAKRLAPHPFTKIHVGFIPQTFGPASLGPVAWAHVDVDMATTVRNCIAHLYPRLVPCGVMIFDDYGFPSCSRARIAVDEAFAGLPEVPLCLPTGQCMIVKLPEVAPR